MRFTRMALSDIPVVEKDVEVTKIANESAELIQQQVKTKARLLKLRLENLMYEEFCRGKQCETCSMSSHGEPLAPPCNILVIQGKISCIIDKEMDI